MTLAIVVLNWNGRALLDTFLPTLVKHSEGHPIYLVDNASTDNSLEYVRLSFPEVRIIQNASNYGYAKGYNHALKKIDADIYCLLNSDVEVTDGWILPILKAFEAHKNTAVAQPKILDYKNKNRFEYAGAGGGFIDKFGFPYCRGRIVNQLERDSGQYDDIIDIFWVTGACMFVRKDVFFLLEGFDEDFFCYQEEIDFCWRLHNTSFGFEVKYIGLSCVYHVGSATLSNNSPRKTFFNFRNSLLSLTKNLPAKSIVPIILSRLFIDFFISIIFLLEGKFRHVGSVVSSHFSYYSMMPRMLSKRRQQLKKITTYNQTWSIFLLLTRNFLKF